MLRVFDYGIKLIDCMRHVNSLHCVCVGGLRVLGLHFILWLTFHN